VSPKDKMLLKQKFTERSVSASQFNLKKRSKIYNHASKKKILTYIYNITAEAAEGSIFKELCRILREIKYLTTIVFMYVP
jgi:hypothetical protein